MTQPTTYDEADEILKKNGYWRWNVLENGMQLRVEVYASPIRMDDIIGSVKELLGEGWEVKKGNTDTIFVTIKN